MDDKTKRRNNDLSKAIISEKTLLDAIHFVREGAYLSEKEGENFAFFGELYRYQKTLIRSGRPTISLSAIRVWARGGVPKRLEALRFLRGYLWWIKGGASSWSEEQKEKFEKIDIFLTKSIGEPTSQPFAQSRDSKSEHLDAVITSAMLNIINASNHSNHYDGHDLFNGGLEQDDRDMSYYLMFRYSTNNGTILKSFLVVHKPIKGLNKQLTFNHFIWGSEKIEFTRHIFRECEGFILTLEKSYYFVGYNYIVHADKKRDSALYKKIRPSSKLKPNGIGLIAVEYDDIRYSPGIFGGLTMTVAAMGQPVISRVAILHLGTKSALGVNVTDEMLSLGEISPEELEGDLVSTIDGLQKKGCRSFGDNISRIISSPEWKTSDVKRLAKHIESIIDNTSAWEKINRTPSVLKEQFDLVNRGAIETTGIYSGNRPRD